MIEFPYFSLSFTFKLINFRIPLFGNVVSMRVAAPRCLPRSALLGARGVNLRLPRIIRVEI